MSVYKKLQDARIKLLNSKLSKSGKNKFAGFEYFELADFLPTVQKIFSETGLGSSITFSADVAVLTIVDVENASDRIEFHSPVVVPTMKGCNEIQALGAAQTYLRRYLYVNALEIVEHDAIDATSWNNSDISKETKTRLPTLSFDDAEKHFNAWIDEKVKLVYPDGTANEIAITEAWGRKPSNVRTAITKFGRGEFEEQQSEVSPEAKAHLNSI